MATETLAADVAQAVLNGMWQGLLLAAAAECTGRLLRGRSPALVHAVWLLALVGNIALPVLHLIRWRSGSAGLGVTSGLLSVPPELGASRSWVVAGGAAEWLGIGIVVLVATTAVLLLAAAILAYGCSVGESAKEGSESSVIVAQSPAPGGRALRQTEVGAELEVGYDGRLTVKVFGGRAEAVAIDLGVDEVLAEVLPGDKAATVAAMQAAGNKVAFVGDGINDAPALAQADIGIAMGTGTDVAIESAGITLLRGDLMGIVDARRLSLATMRNIRQNLFFAFIYNAAGVPIAAGILYPVAGILLTPIFAAAAMSLSSVSVITNALRLRTTKLGRD